MFFIFKTQRTPPLLHIQEYIFKVRYKICHSEIFERPNPRSHDQRVPWFWESRSVGGLKSVLKVLLQTLIIVFWYQVHFIYSSTLHKIVYDDIYALATLQCELCCIFPSAEQIVQQGCLSSFCQLASIYNCIHLDDSKLT